jgi:MSHA biogenesis protein MshL
MSAIAGAALALGACSSNAPKRDAYSEIQAQMAQAAAQGAPAAPVDAVSNALLPPVAQLAEQLPKARAVLDERFNVSFNNVPVQQFFNSIAAGTRYNMLIHPDVSGAITANLKDVTLFEALDAVRELYGYDYKVDGTRIYIRPLTMQTRMFQVNYLTASRRGSSNLRVTSTSVSDSVNNNGNNQNTGNNGGAGTNMGNNNNNGGANNNGGSDPNNNGNNQQQQQRDSASVTTRSESDFWTELKRSLEAIVGTTDKETKNGRSVVISPQSGVIVIRAMPEELRDVDQYLKATQLSVDRQVILEAKILEVQLNSSFQTGINWAAFGNRSNSSGSGGFVSPGTTLIPLPAGGGLAAGLSSAGATAISAVSGSLLGAATTAGGSLFGLAFQTSNFSALISFLETQGTVNVLSSPRIATLNNQKAVLKIGTDEFFVTGVTTTTNSNVTGTGVTTSPSVTLQPFFSGVVLDVTPQIDAGGNIILHVHPSVSQVSTVTKEIDLGSAGNLILPLASSNTSEIDSMVRGQDGRVVAIGGLMRQSTTTDRSQVPGAGDVPILGALFRNTSDVSQKSELVVLIKPTIVEGASDWSQDLLDSNRRIQALDPRRVSEHK